jgi:hypothetical protein
MGYIAQVDNDVQAIDEKLDEIEEILLGLPIRPGHKKVIQRKIYELFTEIETGVEMSAVDYE